MSKKKRLTLLSTIIALSLSSTVMAADIDFSGEEYLINDADGYNKVTITTDSTSTGKYGVFGNSGDVTVKELTIDSKIGGIQLNKGSTPTKLTLSADNMTFKNDQWSAFYTTTWQSRNEAQNGSSITAKVKDTLNANVFSFIGTGADKSVSITAKKIDVNSSAAALWGCGKVNIKADDVVLKSGKVTNIWAENRDSEYTNANKKVGTADYTIVGKNKLIVSSEDVAIRADKGKVALWSDKLIRIKGDILVKGFDAKVMIGRGMTAAKSRSIAPDIEIIGDIEATTGELDLALETAGSSITGNINTGTNQDAVISLSNGAVWQTGNGSSEVSQIAGNHGVIAVNIGNGSNTSLFIHDNQNDDLVIKAAELDTTGGVRDALAGLEQKLAKVVQVNGNNITYATASVDTKLTGEVELKDNRIITTMDTDDLVIRGDVKVGNTSMTDTIKQVNTNKADIAQNKTDIAKNAQDISAVNSNLVTAVDTINQNVAEGFSAINKNVADGFNTINGAIDAETTNRIAADNMLSSRIDSVSSRVDKVGAGAAALAALHPLDYDRDNKLSFASGVGNYAGSTAMAIGAFYRPNENCMMSLGGSMGSGENMVNLGVSFAIGSGQSPYASMSKKDLLSEVQQVKAENEAIKADNESIKAELEQLKAIVAELTAKH